MLTRTPPDKLPKRPPRGMRYAEGYLLALAIASMAFAVLIVAYALPLRW